MKLGYDCAGPRCATSGNPAPTGNYNSVVIECPESQVEKFGIKVFQYESMAFHIIGVFEEKRD